MKTRVFPIAIPLILALFGCVTDYTKSEAPNTLRVDAGHSRIDLAFAPGSGRFAPGEAARLDRLVAIGTIRPADRVTIAAAGPPGLAEQRMSGISRELLRFGIVADAAPAETVPANHAIIDVGRYTVTLPACPNWSESPTAEYTNAFRSNWGCAEATNLGLMVANPADLVSGRPLAEADAMPASDAVRNYLTDHVKQLMTGSAVPFAASAGGGGGGDTGGGGGGPGAGAGAQ